MRKGEAALCGAAARAAVKAESGMAPLQALQVVPWQHTTGMQRGGLWWIHSFTRHESERGNACGVQTERREDRGKE